MENFNLKKFLVENKLTTNSKMLNEEQKFTNFSIGDTVEVNSREGFKELIGQRGEVVGIDDKKKVVFVDFGKVINGNGFSTNDLEGTLENNTGLRFQDRGFVTSKLDSRFDVRNLTKV